MRKKIFSIIDNHGKDNKLSRIYDLAMMFVIIASLVPLAFKEETPLFITIDKISIIIFIIDYILRWSTADLKYNKKSIWSFIRYPFSPMAIIDLLSILPSISLLNDSFRALRIIRMERAFKILRVFRALRYSKSFERIGNVVKESQESLTAVCTLAIGYILFSALVIFNVEPDSFKTFFDAVYWATVSLTTVGYGDLYPTTTSGRTIAMISSFFGIAIVALPAGIITAGYMNELNRDEEKKEDN
ncbi:MAG: ion transporter [bacterium]|nr:ion transporter [bacterium]